MAEAPKLSERQKLFTQELKIAENQIKAEITMPYSQKSKKTYCEYINKNGDFSLSYIGNDFIHKNNIIDHGNEPHARIAFIKDDLGKE